jgi:hypothetical protein
LGHRLVEPQYADLDGTPNRHDFPENHAMAAVMVREGDLVTYGHPTFAGDPFPFGKDLTKSNAVAREPPIDAMHGVVHAII